MAEAQGESNRNSVEDKGFVTERPWVLYQGCWLRPLGVESVKLVQEQFQARPDDVLLVTYPKCGTTWLKALAFTVTNRLLHPAAGDDSHPLLSCHPQDLVPFLEMPYRQLGEYPLAQLEELASPRLLSTHLPVTLLPRSMSGLGCRVVYLCRNPKDVLVSMWHFFYKVNKNYTIDNAFERFARGRPRTDPSG